VVCRRRLEPSEQTSGCSSTFPARLLSRFKSSGRSRLTPGTITRGRDCPWRSSFLPPLERRGQIRLFRADRATVWPVLAPTPPLLPSLHCGRVRPSFLDDVSARTVGFAFPLEARFWKADEPSSGAPSRASNGFPKGSPSSEPPLTARLHLGGRRVLCFCVRKNRASFSHYCLG